MLKVGSKYYTFDELSKCLEEFQQIEQVQLWVRDSRTVVAAAKRARRKSLNPALKYAELTYSCVFGGRRPSDLSKTHNQTSAGGCPFKVRLSTSNDGQALVVKEICHDHNHEPGKKLHEETRRLCKNKTTTKLSRKSIRYLVNKPHNDSSSVNMGGSGAGECLTFRPRVVSGDTLSLRFSESPFQHLQVHRIKQHQQQQRITLQLEQHLHQQRILEQRHQQEQFKNIGLLDSPEHSDSSSSEASSPGVQLASIFTNTDQYSYLPPSPISPSSSLSSGSRTSYSSDEEDAVEPILDLDVALEEALGDLDSVSSLDLDDKFSLLTPSGLSKQSPSPTHLQLSVSAARCPLSPPPDSEPSLSALPDPNECSLDLDSQEVIGPPPAKRLKARPPSYHHRSRLLSGSGMAGYGMDIPDIGLNFNDLVDFDLTLF